MKSSLRLAVLTCASFVGFALAAPALAAYTPSLTMEQSSYKPGAAITADVFISAPQNNDPTAKLTIFAPAGYTAKLTAAPGTKIGRVAARVKLLDLAGGLFDTLRQRSRSEPGRSGHPGGCGPVHPGSRQPDDVGPQREPPGTADLDPGVREQGRAARHSADLPSAAGRADGNAGKSDARGSVGRGRLHDPGRIHECRPEASTSGRAFSRPIRPAPAYRTPPERSSGAPMSASLRRSPWPRPRRRRGSSSSAGSQ